MARPTKYSKELATIIIDRLINGESLRAICHSEDMPDKATIFRWLASNAEFNEMVTPSLSRYAKQGRLFRSDHHGKYSTYWYRYWQAFFSYSLPR